MNNNLDHKKRSLSTKDNNLYVKKRSLSTKDNNLYGKKSGKGQVENVPEAPFLQDLVCQWQVTHLGIGY